MKKYLFIFAKSIALQVASLFVLVGVVFGAGTIINSLSQSVSEGDIMTSNWYNLVNNMLGGPHIEGGICSYSNGKIMCNNFPVKNSAIDGVCGNEIGVCSVGTPTIIDNGSYDCTNTFDCNWGACAGNVACDTDENGSRNPTLSSMCSEYSVCWGDGSYDTGIRCKCNRINKWSCSGINGGKTVNCSMLSQW